MLVIMKVRFVAGAVATTATTAPTGLLLPLLQRRLTHSTATATTNPTTNYAQLTTATATAAAATVPGTATATSATAALLLLLCCYCYWYCSVLPLLGLVPVQVPLRLLLQLLLLLPLLQLWYLLHTMPSIRNAANKSNERPGRRIGSPKNLASLSSAKISFKA